MTSNRPGIITAFCIIGFIGTVITIIAIPIGYSSVAESIGEWYPPYLVLTAIINLACIVGLWMMKKWSIIIYTVSFAINEIIVGLATGDWHIYSLIIIAAIIAFVFSKYDEME